LAGFPIREEGRRGASGIGELFELETGVGQAGGELFQFGGQFVTLDLEQAKVLGGFFPAVLRFPAQGFLAFFLGFSGGPGGGEGTLDGEALLVQAGQFGHALGPEAFLLGGLLVEVAAAIRQGDRGAFQVPGLFVQGGEGFPGDFGFPTEPAQRLVQVATFREEVVPFRGGGFLLRQGGVSFCPDAVEVGIQVLQGFSGGADGGLALRDLFPEFFGFEGQT